MRRHIHQLFTLLMVGSLARAGDAQPGPTTPITSPVTILADTQQRAMFGSAQLKFSQLVDRTLTSVTLRPVQQDLFGTSLLKSRLLASDIPVIHLGDFMDVSCRAELGTARGVLALAPSEVVLALGNHDGYFVGNYMSDDVHEEWAALCDTGRYYKYQGDRIDTPNAPAIPGCTELDCTLMHKGEVVESLLADISARYPAAQRSDISATTVEIRMPDSSPGMLRRVYARRANCKPGSRIASCKPQRSFILQLLRLPAADDSQPAVHVLLMDTSNRAGEVSFGNLFNTPGKNAFIEGDQWRIVDQWIDELRAPGGIVLVAGHHPLSDWSQQDRKHLMGIARVMGGDLLYLSAHTHVGYWERHSSKTARILELNVGSMLDSPVHQRRLQLLRKADGAIGVQASFQPLKSQALGCRPEWKPAGDEPHSVRVQERFPDDAFDYFESMKRRVLAALHVYRDMLQVFPDADISAVAYATARKSKKATPAVVRFASLADLQQEIDTAIRFLSGELKKRRGTADTRNVTRLALTIGAVRLSGADQSPLEKYRQCQALFAAEDDEDTKKVGKTGELRSVEYMDFRPR